MMIGSGIYTHAFSEEKINRIAKRNVDLISKLNPAQGSHQFSLNAATGQIHKFGKTKFEEYREFVLEVLPSSEKECQFEIRQTSQPEINMAAQVALKMEELMKAGAQSQDKMPSSEVFELKSGQPIEIDIKATARANLIELILIQAFKPKGACGNLLQFPFHISQWGKVCLVEKAAGFDLVPFVFTLSTAHFADNCKASGNIFKCYKGKGEEISPDSPDSRSQVALAMCEDLNNLLRGVILLNLDKSFDIKSMIKIFKKLAEAKSINETVEKLINRGTQTEKTNGPPLSSTKLDIREKALQNLKELIEAKLFSYRTARNLSRSASVHTSNSGL